VERVLSGRSVVSGSATGVAVVSSQPISFWGDVDPQTGEGIDRWHERCGEVIIEKVFVFPREKDRAP